MAKNTAAKVLMARFWWASLAIAALNYLRPFVKLSGPQAAAWDLVIQILQSL